MLWLGSRSMIAWWRIRPHRKQWDWAAIETARSLTGHFRQAPTFSRDLVGPAFHSPELEIPRTSWLFSAACRITTLGLTCLFGFATSIAFRPPFDPWLWFTFGVTCVACILLVPKLMAWERALKPMLTIKPCPTPQSFQKDGFHQLQQHQLEAMGMVSLGLYQFKENACYGMNPFFLRTGALKSSWDFTKPKGCSTSIGWKSHHTFLTRPVIRLTRLHWKTETMILRS